MSAFSRSTAPSQIPELMTFQLPGLHRENDLVGSSTVRVEQEPPVDAAVSTLFQLRRLAWTFPRAQS